MSKKVVIHQPDFMPYLGFFHRFLYSDLWIILDSVQFLAKGGWHSRDKIKKLNGETWITVNVQKSPLGTPIREIMLAEKNWRQDHLNLLYNNYHKALFYQEIFPYIEALYSFQCEKMIDFNMKSIDMLCDLLDVKIERVMASELDPQGKSNELLVDILKKVNATTYLSGVGAKAYMQEEIFEQNGIEVVYQDYKVPVYPQINGEFIPYLSSLDILFNCGIEQSRKILRSC